MKKILFILICCLCLCLCGCGGTFNGYQFSELSYEKWEGVTKAYNIKGSIKNVSNKTCNGNLLNVTFELKSGSIKDTADIYISNLNKDEIKSFDETIFTNLTDFDLKVKSVDCFLKESTK